MTPLEVGAAARAMERLRDAFTNAARDLGVSIHLALEPFTAAMQDVADAARRVSASFRGTFFDADGNLLEAWEDIARLIESDTERSIGPDDDRRTLRAYATTLSAAPRNEDGVVRMSDELATQLTGNLIAIADRIVDREQAVANPCPDCNGEGGRNVGSDDDGNVIRETCVRCDGHGVLPRPPQVGDRYTVGVDLSDQSPSPEEFRERVREELENVPTIRDSRRENLEELARQMGIDPPSRGLLTNADFGHAIERTLNREQMPTPRDIFLGEEDGLAFDHPVDWAEYVVDAAIDRGQLPVAVEFEGVRAVYQFVSDDGEAAAPSDEARGDHTFVVEVSCRGPSGGEDWEFHRPQFRLIAANRDGRSSGGRAWRVIHLSSEGALDHDAFERDAMRRTLGSLGGAVLDGARAAFDDQLRGLARTEWARPLRAPILEAVNEWRPEYVDLVGANVRRMGSRPTLFRVTVRLCPSRNSRGPDPRLGRVREFVIWLTAPTRTRPDWLVEYPSHPTTALFPPENQPTEDTAPHDTATDPGSVRVNEPETVPVEVEATVETGTPAPPRRRRQRRGRLRGLARSEQRFGDAVRQAIAENVDRDGAGGTIEPEPDPGEAAIEAAREAVEMDAAGQLDNGARIERVAAHGATNPIVDLSGPTARTASESTGVTIREVDSTIGERLFPGVPPLMRVEAPAPSIPAGRRRALEEWAQSVNLENVQAADGPDDPRVYVEAVRDIGSGGIFFAPSGSRRHVIGDRNVTEIEGQIVGGLVARPASLEFEYRAESGRFEVQLSVRSLSWRDGNLEVEFPARQIRGAASIDPGERLAPLALRQCVEALMHDVADELYRQESGGHDPEAAAEIASRRFLGEPMEGDTATPVRALDRYNLIPLEYDSHAMTGGPATVSGRIDSAQGTAGFRSLSRVDYDSHGDEHLIVEFMVDRSRIRWDANVYRRDASDPRGMRTILLRAAYNLGRQLDGLLGARRRNRGDGGTEGNNR